MPRVTGDTRHRRPRPIVVDGVFVAAVIIILTMRRPTIEVNPNFSEAPHFKGASYLTRRLSPAKLNLHPDE